MNRDTIFPRLTLLALTALASLPLSACSQGESPDPGMDTTSDVNSTSAASSATGSSVTSSATSSSATSGTSIAASSTTPTTTTTSAASTATAPNTTESDSITSSVETASDEESVDSSSPSSEPGGSISADATSSEVSADTSSDVTSGGSDEDFIPLEEHFTCINDWDNGPGFRITNVLGRSAEALAVANSPTGGTYPVGTIIQHLPTEAMVKRHAGFSPETKDWEFYVLEPVNGVNTFKDFGPDISTMGSTCKSCHLKADEQWDFVCNTSKDNGGPECGTFDFPQQMRDMSAANAAPCQM